MTDFKSRVEAGVAWLDEHRPGWLERIDLDRLDLNSTCNCILGQEWEAFDTKGRRPSWRGPYFSAIDNWSLNEQEAFNLGFSLRREASDEQYAELTGAWHAEIVELRYARGITVAN